MNCPECGRFLARVFICEMDGSPYEEGHAYYWVCTNTMDCTTADRGVLVAPDVTRDWEFFSVGIPKEHLEEWPELQAELDVMWRVSRLNPQRKTDATP